MSQPSGSSVGRFKVVSSFQMNSYVGAEARGRQLHYCTACSGPARTAKVILCVCLLMENVFKKHACLLNIIVSKLYMEDKCLPMEGNALTMEDSSSSGLQAATGDRALWAAGRCLRAADGQTARYLASIGPVWPAACQDATTNSGGSSPLQHAPAHFVPWPGSFSAARLRGLTSR